MTGKMQRNVAFYGFSRSCSHYFPQAKSGAAKKAGELESPLRGTTCLQVWVACPHGTPIPLLILLEVSACLHAKHRIQLRVDDLSVPSFVMLRPWLRTWPLQYNFWDVPWWRNARLSQGQREMVAVIHLTSTRLAVWQCHGCWGFSRC